MNKFLKTLRRIPADVVRAVATRDIELWDFDRCLCGWAVREQVARMLNVSADKLTTTDRRTLDAVGEYYVPAMCAKLFGGEEDEWCEIFSGTVGERLPAIELAYVTLVREVT